LAMPKRAVAPATKKAIRASKIGTAFELRYLARCADMCLHLTLNVEISLGQENIRPFGYPVNSNHFGGAGTSISGIYGMEG
jgi:hypothetical protein